MIRRKRQVFSVVLTALVVGCGTQLGDGTTVSPSHQPPIVQPHGNLPTVSTAGVTIRPLGSGAPASLLCSPSGTTFAYMLDPERGTAVIGTTAPFHTETIHLGSGRSIVALTDGYAVVTSSSMDKNWLYPLHGTSLGKPIDWRAPTDTWQEWADTGEGPAVVTGGYRPASVALTLSDGTTVPLGGGQVYLSSDCRFGAVVTRTRVRRVIHATGDVMIPSEYQPSPAGDPIVLWGFAGKIPRPLSTIRLPTDHLPKSAGDAVVQTVVFSPDDQYVCVLVQGEYGTGPQLLGQTFIFSTESGQLVGTAPYGNGVAWTPDSKFLWLGTPWPQGEGNDRIVNVEGDTVWLWPERSDLSVVAPLTSTKLLVFMQGRLGVLTKDAGFDPFHGIDHVTSSADFHVAPYGKAALAEFGTEVMLLKWNIN